MGASYPIFHFPAIFVGHPWLVGAKNPQFFPSWAQVGLHGHTCPHASWSCLFRGALPNGFRKNSTPLAFPYYPEKTEARSIEPLHVPMSLDWKSSPNPSWNHGGPLTHVPLLRALFNLGRRGCNYVPLPKVTGPRKAIDQHAGECKKPSEGNTLQCKVPRGKQSATDWQQHLCNARIVLLSATGRNKLIGAMQGRSRHAEQRSHTGGKST